MWFYYSEKGLSHSFHVPSESKVLPSLQSLSQRFVNENNLLCSFEKKAFCHSVLPHIGGGHPEKVTFAQWKKSNTSAPTLVLVTSEDGSPIVDEIVKRRQEELLSSELQASLETLNVSSEQPQSPSNFTKDIQELRIEIAALKTKADEAEQRAQDERIKAAEERAKAENERAKAEERYMSLMRVFCDEKAILQKLRRRILLDSCRLKLAKEYKVNILDLKEKRDAILHDYPSLIKVVGFLLDPSHIRSEGNDVAHSATEYEIAESVTSMALGDVRTGFEKLFMLIYCKDPNECNI